MKAVIQRVNGAALSVAGEQVAKIGQGLTVYIGFGAGDTEADVVAFAQKLVAMRIFSDADGKMNLSVRDIGGSILLISNFTLCADISHGNRPSFSSAMRPCDASALFDYCVNVVTDCMRGAAGQVACGIFGADMLIEQSNDGPITIVY